MLKVCILFHGHIAEVNMFNSQGNIYFIQWHNLLITLKSNMEQFVAITMIMLLVAQMSLSR